MIESLGEIWPFLLILPIVAFLYASVGHGGASGYLALMAVFSFPVMAMKPTALLLNLFVAGIAFIQYYKGNHFRWKLFYPFVITSIPAAFVGGYLSLDTVLYKDILAVLLLLSILRLVGVKKKQGESKVKVKLGLALAMGAVIGLISGMVGIGGGIILSPAILLLNWGDMKETAAVSALFIWVNSASGFSGLLFNGAQIESSTFGLVAFALLGGLAGGYYGSGKFNNKALKGMLATVLTIACIKLFLI